MVANEYQATDDRHFDLIVVGGGVAGLATATFSARAGKRVLVLEQSRELGGRARTKQQDGFLFNQGPHALYRGGRGIEVLRELGIEVHGKMPQVSGAFAIREGRKYTFPAGMMSLLTTDLFGAAAKFEAAKFLASILKVDAKPLLRKTLREWVDERISHQQVRDFLFSAFRIATYTNAPNLISAGAAIEQLQKAFAKNVLYLDGGWQTIVDGLVDAARGSEVQIETGVHVEHVCRNSAGSVIGVRLADGRVLDAPMIVVASSPEVAAKIVENGRESSLGRWSDEAIPVKAACFDVALRYLPRPRAYYAFGIDRPHYLSVHSASARLAPEGEALVHMAKYLSPEDDDRPEATERELEGLLDLVQPGWRDALACRRFLPDMIVMNAMVTARSGGTEGRPGPEVKDIPGLYVVGDWVGKEGLLVDASLASARSAAEHILQARNVGLAAVV
jgi:phytoene dehydrogenase-like protein